MNEKQQAEQAQIEKRAMGEALLSLEGTEGSQALDRMFAVTKAVIASMVMQAGLNDVTLQHLVGLIGQYQGITQLEHQIASVKKFALEQRERQSKAAAEDTLRKEKGIRSRGVPRGPKL